MTKENKAIVICILPKNYYREVEGRKTFSPKEVKDWVDFQATLLGSSQKINYDLELRECEEGFEIITTNRTIESEIVKENSKIKLKMGQEMAALVSRNSTEKGQIICLPEQLKLDPDREGSPEIIDGYLCAKDGQQVSTLLVVQNWLKRNDFYLDGEVIKKIDQNSNSCIVNEHSHKGILVSLLLQQINYSGNYIELGASVLENGGVSKPIKLKLDESVANSTKLLSLVGHLKYHSDERAYFKVLADVETNYEAKGGIVKTKSIKILEITEDGLDKYRH